ncbi:CHAD domain-containing protein [Streptomyces verrucosisporus]|uniref:CHAD domain-containing protein n=1 Tax=Streptomyces verrucosisporus TaxID=1695161 RepID=UPI0027D9FA3A|nr:CHAD domain-containing protein [Streptomyces verrucosisporus]
MVQPHDLPLSAADGGGEPYPRTLPEVREGPGEVLSDLGEATAGEVLAEYLHRQATGFLRGLRLHEESAGSAESAAVAAEAVRTMRRCARRVGAALRVYRPLTEAARAEQLGSELAWLSGVLGRERAYEVRLERLLGALHRLSSAPSGTAGADGAAPAGPPARRGSSSPGGGLGIGAARAGALLERQLTLARTRAHSAALQTLGSARFHAVADAVAVLASEAPLAGEAAARPAAGVLPPLAELAHRRVAEAVDALPLTRARQSYNGEAFAHTLVVDGELDAAWNQVRLLVRLRRYAHEVLGADDPALTAASRALDRHRDAAEAASAAAAAARTPRIAPATAYALGVLHADQRHEVEAARFGFGRLWRPAASVHRARHAGADQQAPGTDAAPVAFGAEWGR